MLVTRSLESGDASDLAKLSGGGDVFASRSRHFNVAPTTWNQLGEEVLEISISRHVYCPHIGGDAFASVKEKAAPPFLKAGSGA